MPAPAKPVAKPGQRIGESTESPVAPQAPVAPPPGSTATEGVAMQPPDAGNAIADVIRQHQAAQLAYSQQQEAARIAAIDAYQRQFAAQNQQNPTQIFRQLFAQVAPTWGASPPAQQMTMKQGRQFQPIRSRSMGNPRFGGPAPMLGRGPAMLGEDEQQQAFMPQMSMVPFGA